MAYIANIFKDIFKYLQSPSFFTFFTTILVPTATGLGWGFNLWYVKHIHRLTNAHGIHRLDSTTKTRLAEIERDRAVQIARLERNGTLLRSAQPGICPRQALSSYRQSAGVWHLATSRAASTAPTLFFSANPAPHRHSGPHLSPANHRAASLPCLSFLLVSSKTLLTCAQSRRSRSRLPARRMEVVLEDSPG